MTTYLAYSRINILCSAQLAGVLLLNEIGLDPGIDHCSAHSLLSRLRSENKQIVSFTSFCGGLPAPEVAEGVPFGYKFSWSPRGVLRATGEGATFRLVGQVRFIANISTESPNRTLLSELGDSGGKPTCSELSRCTSFESLEV
jgi:saccharopine dehydrogenase-like NADP-dependent oxidoreductase